MVDRRLSLAQIDALASYWAARTPEEHHAANARMEALDVREALENGATAIGQQTVEAQQAITDETIGRKQSWQPMGWQPIATALCDDRFVLAYWEDGHMTVEDFDHDSDPAWWAERGVTHWLPLPEPPT